MPVLPGLLGFWDALGVETDTGTVSFASWVDNYYTFGATLNGAIEIAESFESELWAQWGLIIKPDSRCVMSANVKVYHPRGMKTIAALPKGFFGVSLSAHHGGQLSLIEF